MIDLYNRAGDRVAMLCQTLANRQHFLAEEAHRVAPEFKHCVSAVCHKTNIQRRFCQAQLMASHAQPGAASIRQASLPSKAPVLDSACIILNSRVRARV